MIFSRPEPLRRLESGGPASAAPPDLTFRDVARSLWRHHLLLAICIALSVGSGVAYTLWARPVYEAHATVVFEDQRVDVPQLVEALYNDNVIGTEIQVLEGRSAAASVIDSLGLRARLVKPRDGRITALFSVLKVTPGADSGTLVFRPRGDGAFTVSRPESVARLGLARIGDTTRIADVLIALGPAARQLPKFTLKIDPLDDALRDFESALNVSRPVREADLIDIQARAGDPAQAAAIANLMAHVALSDRQAAHLGSTGAEVAFLQQQSDSLGRELRASESELRAYQEKEHVIDVPEQANAEIARLAKLQADLAGVRADRDAFAELVGQFHQDSVTGLLGGQDVSRRLMAFPALLSNQSTSVLLGALAQAETERSQLLIRRMPADSDVQVLTHRIRDIETQLQGMAESYLQSLTNQVAALQVEAGKFRTQLDALPAKELQTARLERNTKVLNDLWVLVQTRLKEAQVTGAGGSAAVRIADAAAAPSKPIWPRALLILPVSLFLGVVAGVSALLVQDMGDRSVRSRGDALAAGGLPVLGALPRLRVSRRTLPRMLGSGRAWSKASDVAVAPDRDRTVGSIASLLITQPGTPAAYTEAFNQLFATLALSYQDRPVKVIVFTSPLPGEGKTLSAINFALAGAQRGLRVLLIDGDLRCGVVNTAMGIGRSPGFSELLAGTVEVGEAARWISLDKQGSLFVMPSGALPAVPGSVLTISRLHEALGALAPTFDLVVIDTPPVNLVADAGLVGSAADAVLLVVRAGHTQVDDLRYAMDRLEAMRAPVLGTLLNDIDLRRSARYDGSYRYLAEAGRYHVGAG